MVGSRMGPIRVLGSGGGTGVQAGSLLHAGRPAKLAKDLAKSLATANTLGTPGTPPAAPVGPSPGIHLRT